MPHDETVSAPPEPIPFAVDTASRILRTARELFLARTFSGLTMDALAHELGMSKRTLYSHFSSKDALFAAIIEATGAAIRREVDAALGDASHGFTHKLRAVLQIVGRQFSLLSPEFVRDLQRFSPACYQRLRDMRERNIPLIFGRLFRIGIAEGTMRDDLAVDFLVEFWLQAMHGMQQPAALERTGLTPRVTFEKGLDLFFLGVLTPAGEADYRRTLE